MTTSTAKHAAKVPAVTGVRQGNCMYPAATTSRPFCGIKLMLNTLEGRDWRPPGG